MAPSSDNSIIDYVLDKLFAEDNRLTPEENKAQLKQALENYRSQSEAPVEEMAAPKKTVKGRDLKVGDVIRAYDENRTIKTIEPVGGGDRYVTFETPGDEDDDSNKVAICHCTGNGDCHTIYVAPQAVPAHLAHGDYIGPCTEMIIDWQSILPNSDLQMRVIKGKDNKYKKFVKVQ
jgi:hypothetical protein